MPDEEEHREEVSDSAKPETQVKTITIKTKIAIIEDAEATGDVAAAYDDWRAGSGRKQVPGIIKCFGARPDFLRQVLQFSNTVHFSEGHLSRRHKEMIASHVSYLNRCPY
jgi:Carboxymuconolactone decarboxylase family